MSQSAQESAERVMSNISRTFDLIMSAREATFTNLPERLTIEFSGEEAEARGSARHVADLVREEGYAVELEFLGQAEPIEQIEDDERYKFQYTITSDGD